MRRDLLLHSAGSDVSQQRNGRARCGLQPEAEPRDKVLKVGMEYLFITMAEVGK